MRASRWQRESLIEKKRMNFIRIEILLIRILLPASSILLFNCRRFVQVIQLSNRIQFITWSSRTRIFCIKGLHKLIFSL